jgi:hypothetical protein
MLSWDETLTDQTPPPMAARVPTLNLVEVSDTHSDAAERLHSGTQVAQDMRRIINGAADVNQLVPFKYK